MRLTTTTVPAEDAGLAGSTYELISGGTDSESQDGNNTESMTGSVGSLDYHRPDDVHSLAGTEQTYDDESVDDTEEDVPVSGVEDGARSNANIAETTPQESDSEDEAHSRSSLEYTQQSLGTPSIPTPEASKIVERDQPRDEDQHKTGNVSLRARLNDANDLFWEVEGRFHDSIVYFITSAIVMGGMMGLMLATGLFTTGSGNIAPEPDVVTVTTTTTASFFSTKPSSTLRPNASSGGMGLIPLQDAQSDDWLFGGNKPIVSFTPQAQGDILVHVPGDVKKTWLNKGCLTVTASRNDEHVDTIMSPVDDGILLKFPKKEAYGVVNLSLVATCRPKVQKAVKVHFGKGIMEEAFEMTKHFAHDLTELVPAAAQEAERRFEDARRSLNTASDNLGHNVLSFSESILKSLGMTWAGARQSFDAVHSNFDRVNRFAEDALTRARIFAQRTTDQAVQKLPPAQDFQDQLQLGLLDAQVSAKAWWLKATGRIDEHAAYQKKASEFIAKKRAAAKNASRTRHTDEKIQAAPRPWERVWRKNRQCKETAGRGRKGTHQCVPVA